MFCFTSILSKTNICVFKSAFFAFCDTCHKSFHCFETNSVFELENVHRFGERFNIIVLFSIKKNS